MEIVIRPVSMEDSSTIAILVGELLDEIMGAMGSREFDFNLEQAKSRAEDFLRRSLYFSFIAWSGQADQALGLVNLYESRALYAEGNFGTIAELYVRPASRSLGIGGLLMDKAREFGLSRGWKRLEVTTPPLPAFQRTLEFYERQGFAVAGGRKLKTLL